MVTQQLIDHPDLDERSGRAPGVADLLRPVPVSRSSGATLQLELLGSPQVHLFGRPIVLRTRKTLALLTYLVLQQGPQPREQLADLLWPEADIDDARASLRTTLSYLRHALGVESEMLLSTTREAIGVVPSAPLDLDVEGLADARRMLRQTPNLAILRRRIETAVQRYRGPFLDGVSLPDAPDFEAWMEGQRTHWRGVVAELLDGLANLQIRDGDTRPALTTLELWTATCPDEEAAWERLIDEHLRLDDGAGARRAWKRYHDVLADLDVDPTPGMALLAKRIDEAAISQQSSLCTPTTESDELDVRDLPFVGRSREWTAVRAAYERTRRGRPEIVIVEGTAGIGKTRLVSQFIPWAQRAGADVIVGRALDTVAELPYAAVVDALRARLDAEKAPDDLLSDLWLAELARLVPELRERYPDLPASIDDPTLGRGRLFEAVVRLGNALAERKPLVLSLDDVQWADAGTRDLVRYAVRRWTESGTTVLIVLTVRRENLRAELGLAQWLGALERETPAVWLALDILEPADLVQLACRLAGQPLSFNVLESSQSGALIGFGAWLAHRTGGHPLSLVHALRQLLEGEVLDVQPTGDNGWTIELPDMGHAEQVKRLDAALVTRQPASADERASYPSEVAPYDLPYHLALAYAQTGPALQYG